MVMFAFFLPHEPLKLLIPSVVNIERVEKLKDVNMRESFLGAMFNLS